MQRPLSLSNCWTSVSSLRHRIVSSLIGDDKLPIHWMTSVARASPHTTSACLPRTLASNNHQRPQLPATATWPLHQARLQCSKILTLRVPNASTSNTTCCARAPSVWKCLVVWTARQRCSTPMRNTGPVNGPHSNVHLQHSLHFLPPQPRTPRPKDSPWHRAPHRIPKLPTND